MKHNWLLVVMAIALSLAGAYVSTELLTRHGAGDGGWLNALCEGGSGTFDCDAVLSSRWGVFPPAPEGSEAPHDGVPVALLGLGYFALLSAWYLIIGQSSHRRWRLLPLAVNGAGLLGSIGFIAIMATQLKVWCPLCLTTHGVNLLLFIVTVLLWRSHAGESDSVPPHPTWRHVVAIVALAALVTRAADQRVTITKLMADNAKLAEVTDEVRNSVETMIAVFQDSERQDIFIRDDDPIRNDRPGIPTLVVWADFECGHCRKFMEFADRQLLPMFDGDVRLVFKNFPANKDCNRFFKDTPHPNACLAAAFAEAARQLGGNDKFWEVHDLLFSMQDQFASLTVNDMAARIGYDPSVLTEVMGSPEVGKRIYEDVVQGIQVGVRATPALFLDGKRVGELARSVPGFWRELGRVYQVHRQKRENGE